MHDAADVAKVFKALCDENRVSIINLLQTGEKCACTISEDLDIAQSKLSYHMKILCESGLVESWSVGKWTHYQISELGRKNAIDLLNELTTKF
ncbi:metalloregulator ArsR/SmtB family transcription factor [Chakrabartyella piscis]|uniref:ArsR/SmtB family transcription factor n=1 Tax=Chakrabartyella piscis TaxID=2918914 RepID=UPI002958870D|nr:metalloregulator ArsR/SmtB family transcription factor [Chakrabartyella piscis]